MFGMALMSPSDQWLFDQLNSMREESKDQHQRIRSDMNAGFDKLRDELRGHHSQLDAIDKRVMKIEIQREDEQQAVARRQWGVPLVLTGFLWLAGHLWDWLTRK